MSYPGSTKKDVLRLFILFAAALLIYYPVFYTEYAYTDELVGLWQWRFNIQDSSGTLFQYGRYITGKLAELLFGSVATIKELTRIRLFSLTGWLLSIPVWYYMLKKITRKEKLPDILAFFSVLYMLCTPSVIISVGWAACFELFLANTTGLLSGYFLYTGIRSENNRIQVSAWSFPASLITGIACLFTYQHCFGCFLLPFLLQLIAKSKAGRSLFIGIAAYFLIYLVYYALFQYSLKLHHIEETARTGLHVNGLNKLLFFLAKPLNSAFHFTYLFNERSIAGIIAYILVAGAWAVTSFIRHPQLRIADRLKYYVFVFCISGFIYLPSLVVKENYASNRTMLPLSMAVFFLVADTLLGVARSSKTIKITTAILSFLFIGNALYNFNKQYLQPVVNEYNEVRKFIENNYRPGTDTVHFIRPQEDFFEKKYGITRSWDEFGVPSTFFGWTPEFLVKQIVFEKTGKVTEAEKLIVKSWPGRNDYLKSSDTLISPGTLLINAEEILNKE